MSRQLANYLLILFFLFTPILGNTMPEMSCKISLTYNLSSSAAYAYTGYGDMHCGQSQKAMTVFSAIKVSHFDKNQVPAKSFQIKISEFKIETLAYLFQNYQLNVHRGALSLRSFDHDSVPNLHLNGQILTNESSSNNQSLLPFLAGSQLRIEQDDFFSFLE